MRKSRFLRFKQKTNSCQKKGVKFLVFEYFLLSHCQTISRQFSIFSEQKGLLSAPFFLLTSHFGSLSFCLIIFSLL